jgi:hypothetical protein
MALRLACGRLGAAQPVAVQPIPDGIPVDAQLAGDLGKRPRPLVHSVNQILPEVREAELCGAFGEALIGGPTALAGAADLRRQPVDAGLINQTADHVNGGVQLARELGKAGVVVTARLQIAVQVGESEGFGAVVQAALLAVQDGEAALDGQAVACWGCWWCFPCARSAGSPTTPEDPP